jgi:hypothetical protein
MAAPGVQGGCGWQGSLGDRLRQRTMLLLLLLLLLWRWGASAQGRRRCGCRDGCRESGATRWLCARLIPAQRLDSWQSEVLQIRVLRAQ